MKGVAPDREHRRAVPPDQRKPLQSAALMTAMKDDVARAAEHAEGDRRTHHRAGGGSEEAISPSEFADDPAAGQQRYRISHRRCCQVPAHRTAATLGRKARSEEHTS